jgi:hypothetical protein
MNPLSLLLVFIVILIAASLVLIRLARRANRSGRQIAWGTWAELGLIGLWAIWVGRDFLNLSASIWPSGRELGMAIQSHFIWQPLFACGPCVMWNGTTNGGAPAFAELYGAILHPLVVVSTLLYGAIDGSKITLIGALAMAGWAQWWLAKVMQLGCVPRLWGAAMAVVGGHLAGKMEYGLVSLVLSTAACSLILAPGLKLALTAQRRATLQLAVILALAILAGQGYLQIGTLVAILPAFLVFIIGNRSHWRTIGKEFALAGLLALLLVAILLVPVIHFWPNVAIGTDSNFSTTQPVDKVLLNLVSVPLYSTDASQANYPLYLYINYIGWIPVTLAVLAIPLVPRAKRRILFFFVAAIGLVLLTSTGTTFRLLSRLSMSLVAGIRYPSLIAGLAVPLIIALATWCLDLVAQFKWPRITVKWWHYRDSSQHRYALTWLVLAVPLVWSIQTAYDFSHTWLTTTLTPKRVYDVVQQLAPPTDRTQWINVTSSEQYWIPVILSANLKLAYAERPWTWIEHSSPPPYHEATRQPVDINAPNYFGTVDELYLIAHPENEYAVIHAGSQRIPCMGHAVGGDIDVDCSSDADGTLTVYENSWSGWWANRDGAPIELGAGQWLSVAAPSGRHHYEFRYRPWDVPVGLALSAIGIVLCIILWRRSARSISHR